MSGIGFWRHGLVEHGVWGADGVVLEGGLDVYIDRWLSPLEGEQEIIVFLFETWILINY